MKKNDLNSLKFLFNIIKVALYIVLILTVIVILVQRFFNNKVSIGGYKMFSVATGSMEPVYKVNDVIITKEVPSNTIKVGDDVAYLGKEGSVKDKIITHRVIGIAKSGGKYTFQTKGVANTENDPLISESQVYGVVAYKPLLLSFLSHIIHNMYGMYFLIIVPIAFLIFLEILDKIKGGDDDEEETPNNKKKS